MCSLLTVSDKLILTGASSQTGIDLKRSHGQSSRPNRFRSTWVKVGLKRKIAFDSLCQFLKLWCKKGSRVCGFFTKNKNKNQMLLQRTALRRQKNEQVGCQFPRIFFTCIQCGPVTTVQHCVSMIVFSITILRVSFCLVHQISIRNTNIRNQSDLQ